MDAIVGAVHDFQRFASHKDLLTGSALLCSDLLRLPEIQASLDCSAFVLDCHPDPPFDLCEALLATKSEALSRAAHGNVTSAILKAVSRMPRGALLADNISRRLRALVARADVELRPLSALKACFVMACFVSGESRLAEPYLSEIMHPRQLVSGEPGPLTLEAFLTFHFYCGLVACEFRRWATASQCFLRVVALPSQFPTDIQVHAARRLFLANYLAYGSPLDDIFSKFAGQSANTSLASMHMDADDRDRQNDVEVAFSTTLSLCEPILQFTDELRGGDRIRLLLARDQLVFLDPSLAGLLDECILQWLHRQLTAEGDLFSSISWELLMHRMELDDGVLRALIARSAEEGDPVLVEGDQSRFVRFGRPTGAASRGGRLSVSIAMAESLELVQNLIGHASSLSQPAP